MGRKALIGRMGDLADRLFYRGEISRREACSKTLFFNAVSALLNMGVLTESVGRSRQGPPVVLSEGYDGAESLDAFVQSVADLRGQGQVTLGQDLASPLGHARADA